MNKLLYIAGAVLIAGFAVLGMIEMLGSQTPYLETVAQVTKAGDRPVQFLGEIVRKESRYDESTDELIFTLRDKSGASIPVRYKGVKPANFDEAEKAVVRGQYIGSEFIANQLNLKCPSRYRGK